MTSAECFKNKVWFGLVYGV